MRRDWSAPDIVASSLKIFGRSGMIENLADARVSFKFLVCEPEEKFKYTMGIRRKKSVARNSNKNVFPYTTNLVQGSTFPSSSVDLFGYLLDRLTPNSGVRSVLYFPDSERTCPPFLPRLKRDATNTLAAEIHSSAPAMRLSTWQSQPSRILMSLK